MNAPERVLKTLNHEEPDRVPAFESTFSNNTIARHYGISPGNLGTLMKLLSILPFRHKVMKKALGSRKSLAIGMRAASAATTRSGTPRTSRGHSGRWGQWRAASTSPASI